MAKGSGGGGRSSRATVTARGLRAGSIAVPIGRGGSTAGPVRITRVVRGVGYGTALNAPAGTAGAQEMSIGDRSTRYHRYTGPITGDRYTDSVNINRALRGR